MSCDDWLALADELLGEATSPVRKQPEAAETAAVSTLGSVPQSNLTSEELHPSQVDVPTSWWATRLKTMTDMESLPRRVLPVKVLSGCTGICAEAEVLKAGSFCWCSVAI